MNMNARIIIVLLLLCCCACKQDTTVLELNYVQNFKVAENPDMRSLNISGLVAHSALAAEDMTTDIKDGVLTVKIRLALARNGLSGSFNYNVPIANNVTRVLFGNEAQEIWRRPTETRTK
jgi:hypothetical protein